MLTSKFVDFSGVVAMGGEPEDVLQGEQVEVIKNEDNFDWLVRQAEGMYRDHHNMLPDRKDPDHFSKWGHKQLFDMVFMCAKEGLSQNPSNYPGEG